MDTIDLSNLHVRTEGPGLYCCDACAGVGGIALCPAVADGFGCTRREGHEGPHIACGTGQRHHPCYVWTDPEGALVKLPAHRSPADD